MFNPICLTSQWDLGMQPCRQRSPSNPFRPLSISLSIVFRLRVSRLSKSFFPFRQPQLHLYLSIGKVEPQRDQRKSSFLNLSNEASNLLFMEQKFPASTVHDSIGSPTVRTDMGIDKKDLAPLDIAVTIPEIGLPVPEGLHLGPQRAIPASYLSSME